MDRPSMDRPSPRGAYSTREVATLLGLSQTQIRSCTRAGFVTPQVGPRGELLFSFQDLVLLRTAKALLAARVPSRRIRIALQNLHSQLPQGQPLTAVRISAQGHHVVARDGAEAWNPESGQTLLDFEVADLARAAEALDPHRPHPATVAAAPAPEADPPSPSQTAAEWYEAGVDLESLDPDGAAAAYLQAIELDPALADAHLNLGRLLHEGGDPAAAEGHYRQALTLYPDDALAAYNLGVALQDQARPGEAAAAYELALALDPKLADAHFNLSGIFEQLGEKAAAFRHLRTYSTLTGGARSGGRSGRPGSGGNGGKGGPGGPGGSAGSGRGHE
jgi:tetratricopeptide (TPR) repeat protein